MSDISTAAAPPTGDMVKSIRGWLSRLPVLERLSRFGMGREESQAAPRDASGQADGSRKAEGGNDLLRDWRATARANLVTVGVFSVFVNLLMLTIPIYLFQISDRVLSSRSLDTLLMLTLMAGMQGVPTELYEAADIDGANAWVKFRHVTLPMISPVLFYNFTLMLIGAFKFFDLAYVLKDARASVLLTQSRLLDGLPGHIGEVICLDGAWKDIARESQVSPGVEVNARDLAYSIYTSGSTGKPKGVQIAHRAVVNFLHSMRREPGFTAQDVLLAVTTLSFDIAGLELFLPLTTGGRNPRAA